MENDHPLRILFVEDVPADAELAERAIRKEGLAFTSTRVETEAAFLKALEEFKPDVVVSDYLLPDFDGMQALKLSLERDPLLPFILFTASTNEETAVACMKAGATDYVLKDRLSRLPFAVQEALEQNKLRLARREAERALRKSEERYRSFLDNIEDGCYEVDTAGNFTFLNPALGRILGRPVSGLIGVNNRVYMTPEVGKAVFQTFNRVFRTGIPEQGLNWDFTRPDGTLRSVEVSASPIKAADGSVHGFRGTVRDITERKKAEGKLRQHVAELETVHTVALSLRKAQTRDEALSILLDKTLAAFETDTGSFCLHLPDSDELRFTITRGWFRQLEGFSVKPGEGIAGTVFATRDSHLSAEYASDPVANPRIVGTITPGWGGACVPVRTATEAIGVLFVSVPLPRHIMPEQLKLLESLAEMGATTLHRMHLHEATVRQIGQLQTLHNIDLAITASRGLRMTLNVLLKHITSQLEVDAASVLLLNPHLQMLEYVAGRGFRTRAVEKARIRLGESFAGRAALERRVIQTFDLAQIQKSPDFAALWAGEGFVAYSCVPLITKGQVNGVLEVFHRSPFATDPDWIDFFEMLADQTAIAVDNSQLFDGLQRANIDLIRAYDSTIEGWSRALDLRDQETEGHTLRVAEMAERLARAAGMSQDQIVHVRRGALLHDIGKMALPDSILLKPGKLTNDEWVIMRKHPQFAFDMLAPISYLKPALDIPYCHQEKWDGTGYPRGLKGEQIPLAARLFAVADVWDALLYERPYREAWSEEKVVEYIKAASGTHFDPKVVELFLRVVSEEIVDD